MPPPTLRIGIVGFGFMGRLRAHAYRSLGFYYDPPPARCVLAGVAARTGETLRRAVDRFGFEFATTDYRELCQREDIDLIDCAVPNSLHRDVLVEALEGGKHVYMDKPLAATFEEAADMARRAAARPRQAVQMAFQYRWVPALLRAKELVEAGALGRVFSARAAYLHAGYADPERPFSWRLDARSSGPGGALFDLGSHAVDLVRHLVGEPREVFHLGETFIRERPLPGDPSRKAPVEVDDVSIILFRTEGGAVGTIESSRLATGAQDELRFEAHGNRGALRFNLMQPNYLEFYDASQPEESLGGRRGFLAIESVARYPKPASLPGPKNAVGWERFHVHGVYEFVRSIVEGRPARPDVLDGARAQAVLEAAVRSTRSGAWEPVPAVPLA